MSWMEEWRKQYERQRAARQAAKFDPESLSETRGAGSALESLFDVVYQQEKKYAGRWGFLDSITNMGRNNGRPKETGKASDAERQRKETGAGRTDAARDSEEPPEPVA